MDRSFGSLIRVFPGPSEEAMAEQPTDRSRMILRAIVEDYIATAEPVGSRTVTRRHGINLSPATVRNVMSDLEEMGYLSSPHTSAGRIPTDMAYRFYVDSLLEMGGIADSALETVRNRYRIKGQEVGEILRETSRMLSSLSHYTGIVLAPRFTETVFRHIEFLKLSGRRMLVVLVTENGLVQNRFIESQEEIDSGDLVRMSNYLNELLRGLTIQQVKQRVLEEMRSEKIAYDRLLSQALKLSEETLWDAETETEVFIEGQANILDQPEFTDIGKMKELFRAFEEKSQLVGLLDRCLKAEGVQIYIGSETHLSTMEGVSVITTTYMSDEKKLGVLGVIGPTRMGYASVIPIVDYAGRVLSKLLKAG